MNTQLNTAVCRTQIGGQELCISTGELATQAGGSVLVQYGETVVLGTATMGRPFSPDANFMPLLVEYDEKYYAAGKIKGSRFMKREGKPNDDAILTARLIDRAIRPLFPEGMINDVQVVLTVLSYDGENSPEIVALIAASAALTLSNIPWDGPLGAVRIGRVADKLIANPAVAERLESDLDLIVAGTGSNIVMLEAGGKEIPENIMLDALEEAMRVMGQITPLIADLAKQHGRAKDKPTLSNRDPALDQRLHDLVKPILTEKLIAVAAQIAGQDSKDSIGTAEREAAEAAYRSLSDQDQETITEALVHDAAHAAHATIFRERILSDSWRADGRALNEVRPLTIKAGVLPRTHGTGLFKRGQTQILTVLTLGGPSDVLIQDTMQQESKKRYIHYYNFPAFSVGEIKPNRGPGRREIGHGALAERALVPVLPSVEEWPPYTMLLMSEVLESHGSSSMASVCGSSLALMDAGVPIKKAVAGIAMGLVSDGANYKVLTDIAGIEDEKGDMDFKVAGTRDGITAIQMDIKVDGLNREILVEALEQARQARLHILDEMDKVIAAPRADLSPYAPRITSIQVDVEKIGDLIGPKGKHINEIIEQTGVEIDINDDGLVSITSNDAQAMAKAVEWVHNMTRKIEAGERFEGRVTKIMNFGAFVELMPGIEGMVHISQFKDQRIENIHDVVKVGDIIPVIVSEIDQMGRINLSHKAAMNQSNTPSAVGSKPADSFKGPKPPR